MMEKKVCAFVYNNCKNDARVLKEAKTLANAGYQMRIIALLDKDTVPYEQRDGFEIIRVEKNPIHYRILKAIRYPFWLVKLVVLKIMGVLFQLYERIIIGKTNKTKGEDSDECLKTKLRQHQQSIKSKGLNGYYRHHWKHRKTILFLLLALTGWALPLFLVAGIIGIVFRTIYEGIRKALLVFHKPLCYYDFRSNCLKIVKKEPADFYHGHDLHALPAAVAAWRKTGGKVIYDSHELYTEISVLTPLERKVYRWYEKNIVPKVDGVITVNESIAEELSKRYQIKKPVVLMNCPVTVGEIDHTSGNLLKEKAGITENKPIILYQGAFHPNRGLQNLVKSAQYIDEAIIVFMGWGKLEEELKALVVDGGLEDKVKLIGPVPQHEVLNYTKGADVGAIPYQFIGLNNYYTSPNKLFDYINTEVAVVGSDFPELKRFIEGYEIGKTFNPESPQSIADAINYVIADPSRLQQMKENTKKAAIIYNWEEESKKLLNLYKELQNGIVV